MPHRRPLALFALAATVVAFLPAAAAAQDSGTLPDGTQVPSLPQVPLDTGGGAALSPEATTPADLLATTPVEPGGTTAPTTPPAAPAAGVPTGTTPVPPPYLVPGAAAAQQPIAAVAELTEPQVPAEPIRLAALLATVLAILAITLAALLRALGLRTPVVDPVALPADGPIARIGERLRGIADDMRDFLRRSR